MLLNDTIGNSVDVQTPGFPVDLVFAAAPCLGTSAATNANHIRNSWGWGRPEGGGVEQGSFSLLSDSRTADPSEHAASISSTRIVNALRYESSVVTTCAEASAHDFDSTGFSLRTEAKDGSTQGVFYLALGFTDGFNSALSIYDTPVGTGASSFGNIAFTPQASIAIASILVSEAVDESNASAVAVGVADDDLNLFSTANCLDDDLVSTPPSTAQSKVDSTFLDVVNDACADEYQISVTGFSSGQVDINQSLAPSNVFKILMVSLSASGVAPAARRMVGPIIFQ